MMTRALSGSVGINALLFAAAGSFVLFVLLAY